MTLRARLVIGLVVLMAVGLTLFGWVLYRLYSDSQYRALNSQLFASVPVVRAQLEQAAGVNAGSSTATGLVPGAGAAGPASSSTTQGGQTPQAGVFISPGTYGELLDPTGRVVSHVQLVTTSSQPRLPDPLPDTTTRPQVVTVASTHGSQSWRVYVGSRFSGGYRVVVAVPMGQVTSALDHLLLTEVVGGAVLLVVLSLGAWLMLRRGLSPMEKMATTADRISAGDLSQRITPQSPSSEVGKLGLALNGMLDQIESAFAQRDATEARLRQFLSDASHELKTPLTSIQGFAELFRLGSDHVDTATIMRRIESESARMKGLVDDLLLLARLDQIRRPGRAPVDLAVLAADACSDVMAVAPDRPVTLSRAPACGGVGRPGSSPPGRRQLGDQRHPPHPRGHTYRGAGGTAGQYREPVRARPRRRPRRGRADPRLRPILAKRPGSVRSRSRAGTGYRGRSGGRASRTGLLQSTPRRRGGVHAQPARQQRRQPAAPAQLRSGSASRTTFRPITS